MSNKTIVALSLLLIFIIGLASGCLNRPEEDAAPKIPESISRGEGQEPELIVYIVEEKQKRKMGLEEYIEGVVAGEMKGDWPLEALGAQAILARTYVLEFVSEKGQSKYQGAHISTDIEEAQAWNMEGVNERIKKAVEMTRGEVAVHDGKYIKAWFHAHSGGITARAKVGLAFKEEEPPYTKVVESPDENAGPSDDRQWQASFSLDEVRTKIKTELGKDVGEIQDISIQGKGESGRAKTIKINDAEIPAPEVRIALGSTKMKSTLLTKLDISGSQVVMEGKGYGHGVGMSQWGARVMAEEGKSPEEIINYYFNNIQIVDLW